MVVLPDDVSCLTAAQKRLWTTLRERDIPCRACAGKDLGVLH